MSTSTARAHMQQSTAMETAAAASSKISYTAGIGAMVIGGLTLQEWFMAVGALTTLGTFIINWYYKHKHFKLQEIQIKKDQIPTKKSDK